jgi:hypothetical protein
VHGLQWAVRGFALVSITEAQLLEHVSVGDEPQQLCYVCRREKILCIKHDVYIILYILILDLLSYNKIGEF